MRGSSADPHPAIVADVYAVQFNGAPESDYAGARAGGDGAVKNLYLRIASGEAELAAVLDRHLGKDYPIRLANQNPLAAGHGDGTGKGDILRARNDQHLLVRRGYLNCGWRICKKAQVGAARYINKVFSAIAGDGKDRMVRRVEKSLLNGNECPGSGARTVNSGIVFGLGK